MKRRIYLEIAVGVVLIAGFFYWFYLRPAKGPAVLAPDDPALLESMKNNRGKVLLIGVDGMTWDVAMDLINRGRMPNLERLVKHGAHGIMLSRPPLISPAIWTTFATGVPREVHGIDNFFAKLPFEYREVVMTSRFRRVPALWQMASWSGRSVGVVNWYAAFPAEEVRGVFVAESMEPGKIKDRQVCPAEWLEKINTAPLPRFMPYEEVLDKVRDSRVEKAYDLDRFVFSAGLEILRENRPDLMMVYFQNIDVISHGFWKYRRPIGLDYSFPVTPAERARCHDVLEMHYEFTDRMIGGFLSEAEDYTVIVASDHGHGATYPPRSIFPDLNKLMERMGWLEYKGATCDGILEAFVAAGELKVPDYRATNIFAVCQELENESAKWRADGAEMMNPAAVEAFISVHLNFKPPPGDEAEKKRQEAMTILAGLLAPEQQRQDILWKGKSGGTRVWNGRDFHKDVQGLYLNLVDREPEGMVPAKDYKSFRSSVIRALKDLRAESGRRLFKEVRANPDKDVMPMTLADAPDILVEIDREALLDDYAYRGPADPDPVPLAAIRWTYKDVSADHVPEGVLVISGKQCKTFRRVDAGILDLAPTVLWLLGLPVGSDMGGRVLQEAFDDPLSGRPPLYITSWSDILKGGADSEPRDISPERADQFKDIGYIQ